MGDGSDDARSVLIRGTIATVALTLCLVLAGCGAESRGAAEEPDPPVGKPVLPDLMPKPQFNVLTQRVGDRWRIRFSTTIVNIGEGDFILRAVRNVRGGWKAEQDVPYSQQGARRVKIRAPLVWGGDGHNHWHVNRIAVVKLVPLTEDGQVETGGKVLVDGKVGFCFYDFALELPRGLAERTLLGEELRKAGLEGRRDGALARVERHVSVPAPGPVDRRDRRACRQVPAVHRDRPTGMVSRSKHTEQPLVDRH